MVNTAVGGYLWERQADGNYQSREVGHVAYALSISLSEDGEKILLGNVDDSAQLWEFAVDEAISSPLRHENGTSAGFQQWGEVQWPQWAAFSGRHTQQAPVTDPDNARELLPIVNNRSLVIFQRRSVALPISLAAVDRRSHFTKQEQVRARHHPRRDIFFPIEHVRAGKNFGAVGDFAEQRSNAQEDRPDAYQSARGISGNSTKPGLSRIRTAMAHFIVPYPVLRICYALQYCFD